MDRITRRDFLQSLAAGSLAASGLRCSSSSKGRNPKNLLLIMTDQQPVSTLGCYGNRLNPTPNIDRIAQAGSRFTQFYIGAFPCSPSRASLLTGCYPQKHGVITNNVMLEDDIPSLGFLLRSAGRSTAYFGKSHLKGYMYRNLPGETPFEGRWHHVRVPDESGFVFERVEGGLGEDQPQLGFDTWAGGWAQYHKYLKEAGLSGFLDRRPKPGNHNDLPSAPNSEHRYSLIPAEHHMATFLSSQAVRFLQSRRGETQPFFLTLSYYGPHLPVAPPRPWDTRYSIDQCPLPPNHRDNLERKPSQQKTNRVCYKQPDWSGIQFRDYIRRYYGYCAFIDEQIGRVLNALADNGLEEDTAVIFTSDHGDMLAAHGMVYKMNRCGYQELANVPLLIKIPGVTKPGSEVSGLVSSVDILPTLIELFGLSLPKGLQGKSFSKALKWPGASVRQRIFIHWSLDSFVGFDGRWKYVLNWMDSVDEFYDLKNDPGELHNLWPDPAWANIALEHRQAIIDWLFSTDHPYAGLVAQDKMTEKAK